jgi:hypothetical protein
MVMQHHAMAITWVLFDDSQQIAVFRPGRNVQLYGEDDTLTLDDLLPGFAIDVRYLSK